MNGVLDGKAAIVTGGPEGIGAATVRRLSDLGAAVMIHYNSRIAPAEALAVELRAKGRKAEIVQANLMDDGAAKTIVDAAVKAFGKIDILVNNAGMTRFGQLGDYTPENVLPQFQVNTFAPLYLIQAAVPHFPPEGGAIINVSTNLARQPSVPLAIYGAAKAAIDNFTLAFAKELGPRNITVNAVAPGATWTPMTNMMSDEMRDAFIAQTLLGRIGQPEDIAGAICFFASPEGRWVTGQSLLTDGGFTDGAFGR